MDTETLRPMFGYMSGHTPPPLYILRHDALVCDLTEGDFINGHYAMAPEGTYSNGKLRLPGSKTLEASTVQQWLDAWCITSKSLKWVHAVDLGPQVIMTTEDIQYHVNQYYDVMLNELEHPEL